MLLDVGSSTRQVRTEIQPWIEDNVFAPLRRRGIEAVHLDVRPEDGVDVVCDITDPASDPMVALGGRRFDLVLCGNLLEHVTDRATTIARLGKFVGRAGYLLVTVPHRFKVHHDPIDTRFRPSPQQLIDELRAVNGSFGPVAADVVEVRGRATHDTAIVPVRRWAENARWHLRPLRWTQACVLLRRAT